MQELVESRAVIIVEAGNEHFDVPSPEPMAYPGLAQTTEELDAVGERPGGDI
jgi:hypothetical protein